MLIGSTVRKVKKVELTSGGYPIIFTHVGVGDKGNTDEMIEEDLDRYYSNIRAIALYDYNQIGVEGQQSHNEGGVSRTWVDRKSLFNGILPLSRV